MPLKGISQEPDCQALVCFSRVNATAPLDNRTLISYLCDIKLKTKRR
jgi:hypothetical protein